MELLYILCQIAAADVCEEHRTLYAASAPMACVTMGQADLARLVRPGWRIAGWRCDGSGERDASLVPIRVSGPTVPQAR